MSANGKDPSEPTLEEGTGTSTSDSHSSGPEVWGRETPRSDLFVRNISATYVAKGIEIAIGLVMLPFNIAYLGQSVYGLWVLIASIPAYFSMLDLGYGVAQVKFVAKYRAQRDQTALNEVASTLCLLFTVIGLFAFAIAVIVAFNIGSFFSLTPDQAEAGRDALIIASVYVAIGFPFSIFGGIVNGFQRNYLNASISIATSITVAVVNIAVLMAGYGLVALVAATTAVRIVAFLGYRFNAYRSFPGLSVSFHNLNFARLREVTGFSVYILLLDIANKLNYSTDVLVIGAFMGSIAVAVWAVAQRLVTTTQDLTTQVSGALFPTVADIAAVGDTSQLKAVFFQGTRLSLAMVLPAAAMLSLLAGPIVYAWVGPSFSESIPVIWILAIAVVVRVGNSTATTVLKGGGQHSFLAIANITAALTNLVLSILLVRSFGLVGVAVGTLVPVVVVSVFFLFPRACSRVEVSVLEAIKQGVWPAVWPLIPAGALLLITRDYFPGGPLSLAMQATASGGVYVIVFMFFAITLEERNWYLGKIKKLAGAKQPPAQDQQLPD